MQQARGAQRIRILVPRTSIERGGDNDEDSELDVPDASDADGEEGKKDVAVGVSGSEESSGSYVDLGAPALSQRRRETTRAKGQG